MLLTAAIVTEVAATFVLLALVLRAGVAVGVAYGIWGASGTALTAVLAAILFRDALTWPIVGGIALIIAGVLFVELGSHPQAQPKTRDAAP
jgi:small multidrug resistance pump